MSQIFHIAEQKDLDAALIKGYYEVASLQEEGFIHCSTKEELVNTANRRFKQKNNLTLLCLDEQKIAAEVKVENLSGGSILYPHIYGKLNLDAVVNTYNLNTDANGNFLFPELKQNTELYFSENHFLQLTKQLFLEHKTQAEKALDQLNEADIFYQPAAESNSIAIIVQHLSGNMISRWTNFLTTDGEKANRNRDKEFILNYKNKEDLMEFWNKGWSVLFTTLDSLNAADLLKIVYIRGQALSVTKALTRQISHYAFHTGQIVYLAKQIKADHWKTLSIARGKSNEFKP
jgi:uncharacterized protein (DUF952 family)